MLTALPNCGNTPFRPPLPFLHLSSTNPRSPPSFSALSLLPTTPLLRDAAPLSWLRLKGIQDLSFPPPVPPCSLWHEYFHSPRFWLCPNRVSTHFTWFITTFPEVFWAPGLRKTLPVLPIWNLTLVPLSSPFSFPLCISLPPNTKCCFQLQCWHSSNCRVWGRQLDWAGMSPSPGTGPGGLPFWAGLHTQAWGEDLKCKNEESSWMNNKNPNLLWPFQGQSQRTFNSSSFISGKKPNPWETRVQRSGSKSST